MNRNAITVIACGASAVLGLHTYLIEIRTAIDAPLRIIFTRSAEQFIRPEPFGAIADEVYTSADVINPMECAQTSRTTVVLPATANMITSAALGLAGTVAQSVVMASTRPTIYFPSANSAILAKPILKQRINELRAQGNFVIEPIAGITYEMSSGVRKNGWVLPDPKAVTRIVSEVTSDFNSVATVTSDRVKMTSGT